VRFLLDQNRSPRLAVLLRAGGHDAVHTLELGLEQAEDDEVLAAARDADRVVVSGDTDFGALLALSGDTSPSVILFRARNRPSAEDQASVILDHLDDLVDDLEAGAVVVVTDDRMRVRRLPLIHDS
jgi:predicted nuclease of predicted toxin-antitoxin system